MGAGWSEVGVEGIPLELVYRVLSHVSLQDLTTLLATSSYLKSLIEESPLLWSRVHTKELWPNEKTWRWFERAAKCGNVEASIKLVVALLYNEGVSMGKPVRNGELAFTLFESLETGGTLGPRSQLWLLYRPPWGAQPLCSKRFVFTRISHVAQLKGASWGIRVLSRISEVVPDGVSHSDAFEINWVKKALEEGDIHARLLHWRFRYEKRHREGNLDPGTELQAIRDMREMCLTGYYPAALTLSHFLATSRCPQIQGLPEIREFLQSSPPSRTYYALRYQQQVTPHMHHVLVDWLCEVANIRLHSSHILHAATQIVEAYLSMEQVTCNQLQLIGITAVLLATRFKPGECILTVTEACWITDDTYCYGHVVRTIGHIMAALRGNVALPTILDYATVLLKCVRAPPVTQEWTRFVCDLATTCAFPPKTTLAQIAASCVMLGFILARLPWPNLVSITGFTHTMLVQPLVIIYSKNFVGEGNKCQRRGISDRYSLTSFSAEQVGMQPMPSLDEMLQVLSLSIDEYMDIVAEHLLFTDDVDTESGTPKCSVRTCPPQPTARPSLHHLPGPHNLPPRPAGGDAQLHPDLPSSGGGGARSKTSGMSGQWRGSEPSRDGHSSSMDYSDSESGSASVSPVWENTHLRTSKVEAIVDGSKATGALSQCQQDQAGVMLPPTQHRHLELQEHNVIPREVGGENLSETTDSEESADLLPEACEGPGAKNARVNLKRKLENASESERSEKYLIRDVGNLQLG
uniref:F-box domain-containing protein n=1 Tax=Scylla olivacea TaxID=85551 RepID=A0A0P4W301_SCYOL